MLLEELIEASCYIHITQRISSRARGNKKFVFEQSGNVESGDVRQPSISILLACVLNCRGRITRLVAHRRRPRAAEAKVEAQKQPISKHVNVAWIVLAIAIKQRDGTASPPHNVLKHFWPRVEERRASSSRH
jgi:hypothetical protein